MSATNPRVLVIGYGNRRRGDDAAGPLALDRLAAMAPTGVTLEEFDGDGVSLLDRWRGHDVVVVIDAVKSGGPPGIVITVSWEQLERGNTVRTVSSHGMGLTEAIRLGRVLGRLPRRLWVVGIEGTRFAAGAEASDAVRQGAVDAAHRVAARWGDPCTS